MTKFFENESEELNFLTSLISVNFLGPFPQLIHWHPLVLEVPLSDHELGIQSQSRATPMGLGGWVLGTLGNLLGTVS